MQGTQGVYAYIYIASYTHQVFTLVTPISCRLEQFNGSLTYPFAGRVTVGACNLAGAFRCSYAAIPPKCYIYLLAYWGSKDAGT